MINKVILIGNLGVDPELRHTQSGTPVASFRIATSERWKDKDGQQQERTEWHSIVAWGRLGELCNEYLNKGSKVYIEGKLQTRKWQDQNGNDRYTTEIIARDIQFLTPRGETGSGGTGSYGDPGPSEPPAYGSGGTGSGDGYGQDSYSGGGSGSSASADGGAGTGTDVPF